MAIEFLNGINLEGTLELKSLTTNTDSTTALVMSGNEVQKRTLGTAAFADTTDFTTGNFVTLDTDQSITGNKTFSGTVGGMPAIEEWHFVTKGYVDSESGEQNVQANWTATSGDAYILNKPTIPSSYAPTNAEQNVQSDWNATSGDAQILNKLNREFKPNNWGDDRFVRAVGVAGSETGDKWVHLSKVGITGGYEKVKIQFTIGSYDDNARGDERITVLYENHSSAQEGHILHWYKGNQIPTLFKGVKSIRSASSGLTNTYDLYVQIDGAWKDSFTVHAEWWKNHTGDSIITYPTTVGEFALLEGSDDKSLTIRERWIDADKLDQQEGTYYLDYDNFYNTPTIPTVPDSYAPTDAEANVQANWTATSGDALILNKPTIPTDHGDHDGLYLPIGGGIVTGDLTVNGKVTQAGVVDREEWGKTYAASITTITTLVTSDGAALPTGGAYRMTGHISGTGTEQVSVAVFWNENGTWYCNNTFAGGTSSNHIEFLISDSVPKIKTWHSNNYNINVTHERLSLNEGTGNDNLRGYFGADSFLKWTESTNALVVPGTIAATGYNNANWNTAYTHSQATHAPTDAEANVQANWTATSGDALILNKPTIPTVPDSYAPTDAEANVQADWTATTTTSDAFILNKPSTFAPSAHTHNIISNNSTNSIDVLDHSNHTWLRNSVGTWSFQTGTSGDDWSQTFGIHLPAAGSTANAVMMELGQRDSNQADGRYKGVRIVNYTGSTVTDGHLQVGTIAATDGTSANWNTAYTHSQAAHAPTNAEQNVQANWTASSGDSFIKNKPSTFAPSAHNQAWSTITSTPTTLGGYGITDIKPEYINHAVQGDHDMHTWDRVHAVYSDASGTNTYWLITTNVPQDNYSMGGFELIFEDDYSGVKEGGTIKIYGYWNPESNGGFTGFKYTTDNPNLSSGLTIEVGRNSSGKTCFQISGHNQNYAQIIAKNLWLGYSASSAGSTWGDSWSISTTNTTGLTNLNTLTKVPDARWDNIQGKPSLLAIGTSATTAMAGNTSIPTDYGNHADGGYLTSQDYNASNLSSGTVPYARTNKVLPTSGNYVWQAATLAGDYAIGVQAAFVAAAQGFPEYGAVLHVGARGGTDAGGDYQLYCGHGSGNGGNHLRFRNADNNADPSDSWTAFKTIWDSENLVNNQGNWNTAHGWGNHADAGYTSNTGTLTNGNDRNYISDTRSAERAPSYYDDRYAQWDFSQSANFGVVGGDSWAGILTVSKWSNWDASHRQEQLIFSGENLWHRTAASDSAWGTSKKIWDSSNLTNNNQLSNGAGYKTTDNNTQLTTAQIAAMGYIKENEDRRHKVIRFTGEGTNSNNGVINYGIYQEGGSWSHPYPDLVIAMHTGIKIGGHQNYGGTRFYSDAPGRSGAVELMSVGDGNTNVNITNSLTVGGTVTASGTTSLNWKEAYGWGNHADFGYLESLPSHNHDTLYLGKTAKAADSETIDGIDSSRIVYGANAKRSTRYDGAGIADPNQNSGFFYGHSPDGGPTTDWTNWMTTAGAGWTSGNNYSFTLAHPFHSDILYVARMTNGGQGAWRQILDASTTQTITGVKTFNSMLVNGNSTVMGTLNVGSAADGAQRDLILHGSSVNKQSRLRTTNGNLHIDSAEGHSLYLNYYYGATTNIYFGSGNGGSVGSISSGGLLRMANDVVAYYSFSDKRLKTDIKSTEGNLDKILSLNPVEYTWKEGPREGVKEIGLIAQEVEEIVPEVVRVQSRHDNETGDGIEYKQVDYEHLVSTLIGAMQEQQKQIDELKSMMCKCKK